MKLIFFLTNGGKIEWPIPVPSEFNFIMTCKVCRADGYFICNNLYVDMSKVDVLALEGSGETANFVEGTGTKQ